MKIQIILNRSIRTLISCNAFSAENSCPLNFAAKASSPSQTDQHIHKAPENILHIQRGWGEISLLYKPPEIQRFAWKNGFELLRPSLPGLGSVRAGAAAHILFLSLGKESKLNNGRKTGQAAGIVPSSVPLPLHRWDGQLAPPLGFTEISTRSDLVGKSIARQANKETTKSCS